MYQENNVQAQNKERCYLIGEIWKIWTKCYIGGKFHLAFPYSPLSKKKIICSQGFGPVAQAPVWHVQGHEFYAQYPNKSMLEMIIHLGLWCPQQRTFEMILISFLNNKGSHVEFMDMRGYTINCWHLTGCKSIQLSEQKSLMRGYIAKAKSYTFHCTLL